MTALQEWLRHHKRHLVQAAIDEALMEYIAHIEKQRDELNRLCEFNEKTTSELIEQRDDLLAALDKAKKELRVATTKAIACESVAEIAVRNARSWPLSWATQPTPAEFVSMALQKYEKEMLALTSVKDKQPKWDGEINPADFKIETYSKRQSGWVMSPDNGVRITHIPTGLAVKCDEERSQHRNRHNAMENLTAMLNEQKGGAE